MVRQLVRKISEWLFDDVKWLAENVKVQENVYVSKSTMDFSITQMWDNNEMREIIIADARERPHETTKA